MAYDKKKVTEIALAEVGYEEKETNSNLDSKTGNSGDENYTKYARDLAKEKFFNASKQGHAWCATFVAWIFYKAFGKSAALKLLCQPSKGNCGAGCKWVREYFLNKKQWHESNPKEGDVIVFYNATKDNYAHTGYVYKVDKTYVYTVEGNTSGASGVVDNGGMVAKKKYRLNYSRIAGYGRPEYGTVEVVSQPNAEVSSEVYIVQRGDTLWGIAKKHYGRGSKYHDIMRENGLETTVIRPGMKLKITKA